MHCRRQNRSRSLYKLTQIHYIEYIFCELYRVLLLYKRDDRGILLYKCTGEITLSAVARAREQERREKREERREKREERRERERASLSLSEREKKRVFLSQRESARTRVRACVRARETCLALLAAAASPSSFRNSASNLITSPLAPPFPTPHAGLLPVCVCVCVCVCVWRRVEKIALYSSGFTTYLYFLYVTLLLRRILTNCSMPSAKVCYYITLLTMFTIR